MGRYVWPEYLFLTLRLCYWISFIQNPHTCVHSCIMSCTQFYIYKEEQISHGASGRKWWSFSEREARTTKQQQLEETPTSVWEGQPKRPTFPELFLQSADGLKIQLTPDCGSSYKQKTDLEKEVCEWGFLCYNSLGDHRQLCLPLSGLWGQRSIFEHRLYIILAES